MGQAPVAHAGDPSYSGGRDQEDHGSKPAQDLEKTHHKKRAGGVAQGEGPEFKSQYHKKKKKNSKIRRCSLAVVINFSLMKKKKAQMFSSYSRKKKVNKREQ
jgi:hypothetical protein